MALRGAASSAHVLHRLMMMPHAHLASRPLAPAWHLQGHAKAVGHAPLPMRSSPCVHALPQAASSSSSSSARVNCSSSSSVSAGVTCTSSSSSSGVAWASGMPHPRPVHAAMQRRHAPMHGGHAGMGQGRAAGSPLTLRSFASSGLPPSPQEPWPYPDIVPLVLSPAPCRVVVIGWMGSKARYVRKYADLWQATGDNAVITIRPTITQTLVRFKGVVQAGADIDKVARLQIENPGMPTFYHIFSTGGFTHAGTMWRWMDEVEDLAMREALLGEVAGIILDSAPSRVEDSVVARAVVSAVSGVPAEEVEQRLGALVGPARSFFRLWLNTKGIKLRQEEVFDAWLHRAPSCPQLYLYSDSDPLVDPAYVEEYMKVQEGRGVSVYSHRFSGSGHCEHYRRHPHDYALQLSSFVSKALGAW